MVDLPAPEGDDRTNRTPRRLKLCGSEEVLCGIVPNWLGKARASMVLMRQGARAVIPCGWMDR